MIQQLSLNAAYRSAVTAGLSLADIERPRSVGYGLGLAVLLFVMQVVCGLMHYQSYQISQLLGMRMRSAVRSTSRVALLQFLHQTTDEAQLVSLISRKSMRLSTQSRLTFTSGKINTMISSDASYCDWVMPQTVDIVPYIGLLIAGTSLLIWQLGYSALVGLGVSTLFQQN